MRRVITGIGLAGLLSGCWLLKSAEPQAKTARPLEVRPLPGGLDESAFFDSNSPEIVQTPGILLSTLAGNPAVHQNYPIRGEFTVFSHHIAKDETADEHRLYVGLLAVNQGDRTATVGFGPGASYLSQPDALFVPLPTLTDDPGGSVYAGPGDRVATDLVHGRSNLPAAEAVLPPHGSYLAYSLPIPTNVAIPPPINGRTTVLRGHADGPIRLAEVAVFAQRDGSGAFIPPGIADYQAELQREQLAGPRDVAPTSPFDRSSPPPKGGFKYGRVAGVAHGSRWLGRLEAPAIHGTLAYPIASLYLNRLGTSQDQSAPLDTRYPDTAYEAHGNYGVTYELTLPLAPGRYALGLSHPLSVGGGQAQYVQPPNKPVMFRGPIKLTWEKQTRYVHVVLHHGEDAPPFARIEVPPGKAGDLTLTLSYPADATPPQLLTVTRE